MTILETQKIDIVSIRDGKCFLIISNHLVWDEKNTVLEPLQDKVNLYLEYIESGQLYQDFPHAKDCEIVIRTVCQYSPSAEGLKFEQIMNGLLTQQFNVKFELHIFQAVWKAILSTNRWIFYSPHALCKTYPQFLTLNFTQ